MCLPDNTSLQFEGKYSSNLFKYVKISLQLCSSTAEDPRPCAGSSFIDNWVAANGAFTFNYYFLNTLINPDSLNPIATYLEDRNYYQFTRTLGMTANIFISSYTITTDTSLWPFKQTQI